MPKGGKREGAGNKPLPPGEVKGVRVMANLDQATGEAFHRLRGERKAADVLRELVEKWIKDQTDSDQTAQQ